LGGGYFVKSLNTLICFHKLVRFSKKRKRLCYHFYGILFFSIGFANYSSAQFTTLQGQGGNQYGRTSPQIKAIGLGNFSMQEKPTARLHINSNLMNNPEEFSAGNVFRTDGPSNTINSWVLWTGGQFENIPGSDLSLGTIPLERFKLYVPPSSGNVFLQVSGSSSSMVFNTGGENERMRINNQGRIGVGTSSPQYLLDVNGDGRFSGTLYADNLSLTNPVSYNTLHINKSLKVGNTIYVNGDLSTDYDEIITTKQNIAIGRAGLYVPEDEIAYGRWDNNPANQIRLGVGTNNPRRTLHVKSIFSDVFTNGESDTYGLRLEHFRNSQSHIWDIKGEEIFSIGVPQLSNIMEVFKEGRVAIGTNTTASSTATRLHIHNGNLNFTGVAPNWNTWKAFFSAPMGAAWVTNEPTSSTNEYLAMGMMNNGFFLV
jgi:hypothetical protein